MPEIMNVPMEVPISNFAWTFDTLRVYLLSHIVAAQQHADAADKNASAVVVLNDTRYHEKFGAVENEIAATREAYALRDDKVQITIDLVAHKLEELIHANGLKYEVQFRSQEEALRAQLIALRENTQIAFQSSEKAIEKAALASEKRFDSVNEFRQTLTDQTATFMPRAQVETMFANVNEKVNALAVRAERTEGVSSGGKENTDQHRQNTALWIALASGFIAFLSLLIGGLGLFIANYHKG